MNTIGALLGAIYVSFGMTGLPFLLIKGTRSLEDESDELQGSLQLVRSQLRRIQEKYKKKQDHVIATKDRHLLKKLREDEKALSQKQLRITTELQKK